MEVKDIIEFLKERPGYKKEGAKRLALKVLKGKVTVEDCKEALQIVNGVTLKANDNITLTTSNFNNTSKVEIKSIPSNLKLRSRWQSANGEWLESYRTVPEQEVQLTKDDIEDSIYKVLTDKIEPVKIPVDNSVKQHSMLVWTSDKHIGADTTEAQHFKPYNKYKFIDRMHQLGLKIVNKTNLYGKFDTLVVADLGDAIDGQDGYTSSRTHRLPQNMTNKEVFETYLQVHMKFVDLLIEHQVADKYEFWFNTNSNHGGDFEYTCHRALQVYISLKYPDITIKSFDKFIGHTKFKDVTYLLTHGKDDTNRKFGLPLYPDAKTEVFIDNYLKLNKLSLDNNIRLIKGDLHQSASVPCKNINRYRNVASLFGSSAWVMDNFGYTPPGTDYEIYDESTGEIIEGTFWFD